MDNKKKKKKKLNDKTEYTQLPDQCHAVLAVFSPTAIGIRLKITNSISRQVTWTFLT